MTEPHLGMRVWSFNPNRRVYERDASGKAKGGPIWRECWEPLMVVGETKVSWLVGPEFMIGRDTSRAAKVPKKSWPGAYKTSEAEIDRVAFIEARWELANRVKDCRDYDTLKAIEASLDAVGK